MPQSSVESLAAFFRETGRAHHLAFAEVNGDDPDWATWYARYLRSHAWFSELGEQALAATLVALETERARLSPESPWPEYYAEALAKPR